MDIQDYKWLLIKIQKQVDICDDQSYIVLSALYQRDRKKLEHLFPGQMQDGKAVFPMDEFVALTQQMKSAILVERQKEFATQNLMANKLATMTCEQIAAMSNDEKIQMLDQSFLPVYGIRNTENADKNLEFASKYTDKLRALLFSIDFPKDFIKEEEAKNDRFNQLLKGIPNLKENLENYKNLTNEQRLDIASAVLERFSYVYGVDKINVKTYTEDEYKKQNPHNGKEMVPTGYAQGKTIFLNADRLPNLENLSLVDMVYHESLHVYQHDVGFEKYPSVDKMMEGKIGYAAAQSGDKTELYQLLPIEQHAYSFGKRTKDFLQYDMGIRLQESSHDDKTQKYMEDVHSKAYAAFDRKKFRVSER
jgi:hypothetical protein